MDALLMAGGKAAVLDDCTVAGRQCRQLLCCTTFCWQCVVVTAWRGCALPCLPAAPIEPGFLHASSYPDTANGGGLPAATGGPVLTGAARFCGTMHAERSLAAPHSGAAHAASVHHTARVRPPPVVVLLLQLLHAAACWRCVLALQKHISCNYLANCKHTGLTGLCVRWTMGCRQPPADLRTFMRSCMYDAAEKLEDAVAVLTSRFYNNLSYNWRDSDSIAAYYASDAVRGTAAVGHASFVLVLL